MEKEKLVLRQPLLINGKEHKELAYDFNEIDCDGFSSAFSYASSKSLTAAQKGKPSASIMEQDTNFHMYLGMAAIIAVNPEIDVADLERIKGYDLVQLAGLGRNFITGRSEEPLSPSSSEELSEATPEPSTPESKK